MLHCIGVRHHSPACARLVESTLRAVRPRTVLVEGPCDLNGRLDELLLDHSLPIALYSFLRHPDGVSRASWYPLCDYSPEWVAIKVGRELGCDVRFMDLPAWHDAFSDVTNLRSDRVDRYDEAVRLLCERTRTSGHDALWDHLFESVDDPVVLAAALEHYFTEIRELSPVGRRDATREEHMRAYVSAALARSGDVVVVCGGFHAPVLTAATAAAATATSPTRRSPTGPESAGPESAGPESAGPESAESVALTEWPPDPVPAEGVAETYLVPYSYLRLDSFTGYQSGMPSPAYYEALFRYGPARAGDEILASAVAHLRRARQSVSTADLVAVRAQTESLARLRAHPVPLRVDVLDGLASGLLKDASEQPLPWDRRAPLHPRTHPVLAAIVAAFSGDRVGRLDQRTPRPPLLADAAAELAACDLTIDHRPRTYAFDLTRPLDRRRSVVLHRLRLLGIPGLEGPGPGVLAVQERWLVQRSSDADVALIEASVYGPTLAAAAEGMITRSFAAAVAEHATDRVASGLLDALRCDLAHIGGDALAIADEVIDGDQDIARLGRALDAFAVLSDAEDVLRGLAPVPGQASALVLHVGALVGRCVSRFAWLLEQVAGPSSANDEGVVQGVAAVCRTVRRGAADLAAVQGVFSRRAVAAEAPPAVRGACLGAQLALELTPLPEPLDATDPDPTTSAVHGTTGALPATEEAHRRSLAVRALAALPSDEQPGDFLLGLFAVARNEVTADDQLLAAIDTIVDRWSADRFLGVLPAMRNAFRYFPARERASIADRVAALRGLAPNTRLVGQLSADPVALAAGMALDERIAARIRRYGLEP